MRVLAIVLVVTCSIGFVTPSTQFSRCKSGPLPIKVNINDCVTAPCEIPKDSLIVTSTQFTAVADADSLTGTVALYKGNEQLAVINNNDICSILIEGSCPVKKGDTLTISYNIKSLNISPGDVITTETTVTDSNSNVDFCFDFDLIHADS